MKNGTKTEGVAAPAAKKRLKVSRPLQRQRYSLRALISKVTPENCHPETDWGKPIGKEIW
jgi:antitoxin component of MazEF toxin-antitoxin module